MPRPPITNPACERIMLRVTPADKKRIKRFAKRAGISVSAYLLARALDTPKTSRHDE